MGATWLPRHRRAVRRLPNPASSTCGPATTASGGSAGTAAAPPCATCAACTTCTCSCRGPGLDVPALALSDAVAGNVGARAVGRATRVRAGPPGPRGLPAQAGRARRRAGRGPGARRPRPGRNASTTSATRCWTSCGRPPGSAGGPRRGRHATNAPGSPSARPSPPPSTGSRRSTRRSEAAGDTVTTGATCRYDAGPRPPGPLGPLITGCGIRVRRRADTDPRAATSAGVAVDLDAHGVAPEPVQHQLPGLAHDRHRPVGLLGDDPLARRPRQHHADRAAPVEHLPMRPSSAHSSPSRSASGGARAPSRARRGARPRGGRRARRRCRSGRTRAPGTATRAAGRSAAAVPGRPTAWWRSRAWRAR